METPCRNNFDTFCKVKKFPKLHAAGGEEGFGQCPKERVFFLGFLPLGNRSDVDVDPDLCFSGNTFF